VERDVHVDEHREIVGDLRRAHQLEQHLDCNHRIVLDELRKPLGREPAMVDQLGVRLELGQDLLLLRRNERALQRSGARDDAGSGGEERTLGIRARPPGDGARALYAAARGGAP
jgi:hypothetical protein